MNRLAPWTLALALASSVCACSSEDPAPGRCTTAPITIAQGTWCITINGTTNDCASYSIPPPYTATFVQSGSTLTATSSGTTYTGALCGASGAMSGTSPTATVSVQVEFSDASHATGTVDWRATTCGGTDTLTAHAGYCP